MDSSNNEDASSIFSKIPEAIRQKLESQGITKPTPIQQSVFEPIIQGKDIIAQSRTGSGKTLAFGLPALANLLKHLDPSTGVHKGHVLRLLVLTPTRELAEQVAQVFQDTFQVVNFKTLSITGGKSYRHQLSQLHRGIDAIVATPGRLTDLMNQGAISYENLEMLILDEMDEMLDFGFADDILKIRSAIGKKVQTLLFSATFPNKVKNIAKQIVQNPIDIAISNTDTSTGQIEHEFLEVKWDRNLHGLIGLLLYHTPEHVLIFCRTREETRNVYQALDDRGFTVGMLNGDMTQAERSQTMERFKNRSIRVLVATDVAARGIDVTGLSHVINYSVPQNLEAYTHRCGRTGRAGLTGKAWTLVSYRERREYQMICEQMKIDPLRLDVPQLGKIAAKFVQHFIQSRETKPVDIPQALKHSIHEALATLSHDESQTLLTHVLMAEAKKQFGTSLILDDVSPTVKTDFGYHMRAQKAERRSFDRDRYGSGGGGRFGRSSGGGYSSGGRGGDGGGKRRSFGDSARPFEGGSRSEDKGSFYGNGKRKSAGPF